MTVSRHLAPAVVVGSLIMAVAGCAPAQAPTPTVAAVPPATMVPRATAAPSSTAGPKATVAPTPPAVPAGAEAALAAAVRNLSKRLNVPAAEISLVRVETVDWPDSSLGCPVPGMAYAQVITPGYRLILAAGQATHEFHASVAGLVVSCP